MKMIKKVNNNADTMTMSSSGRYPSGTCVQVQPTPEMKCKRDKSAHKKEDVIRERHRRRCHQHCHRRHHIVPSRDELGKSLQAQKVVKCSSGDDNENERCMVNGRDTEEKSNINPANLRTRVKGRGCRDHFEDHHPYASVPEHSIRHHKVFTENLGACHQQPQQTHHLLPRSSLVTTSQRTCLPAPNHLILNAANFKMKAVLFNLLLLTFTSTIVVPVCQATSSSSSSSTAETGSVTSSTMRIPYDVSHFTKRAQNTQEFDVSRAQHSQNSFWTESTVQLETDGFHAGNFAIHPSKPSYSTSHANVSGSSKNTRKANVVRVPVVRPHSSGFISIVDDPSSQSSDSSVSVRTGKLSAGALVGEDGFEVAPQLIGVGAGVEDSYRVLTIGPCLCWNTTDDGRRREVECKCSGDDMTNVDSSLPSDIHRLTVEQADNFTSLENDDLRPYGNSLRELVLTELKSFQTIQAGTFVGMGSLNTIYIHGTPALTQIPDDVFNVYLPELKIIRITHSSLEVVPNLSQLRIKKGSMLHMVELENNKISRLAPGTFNGLVTEYLALSYNDLEEIGPSAFNGSTIARLTLKGNPLKVLHSTSFVGIDSLQLLDLSETKITYLPTDGLKRLEYLRLEKVWTLSVIPSIFHFEDLKEAWLTWPYHCCAFEFPETHDPVAYQKYQDFVRSVVNLCANASENISTSSTELPDQTNGESSSPHTDWDTSMNTQRQKRHLRRLRETSSMKGITDTRHWNRMTSSGSGEQVSWNNEDTQRNMNSIYNRDKLVLSHKLLNKIGMEDSASNPRVGEPSSRLRKRSVNGHHPRQVRQKSGTGQRNDEKVGDEKTGSEIPAIRDGGFHHPHVQPNVGTGSSNPSHPFDGDDGSTIPSGKLELEDPLDSFVLHLDQSLEHTLDPHDGKHASDIMDTYTWEGIHGHGSAGGFDEEMGHFHPSVTPSPTVITLCGKVSVRKSPKVSCHPLPDAFNPCEDIMGSIWLRGAVWVVVALALVGNTAVLVVLLLAPGRISVQRFLMANLSLADLCMGLYLLMVATQDLVSLGSYFNYAIDWQLGWGCQIAGFLTVFASELSVFTLAVITGERWYALTRAIHLTKRLTLWGAAQLMAFGWFMAILLGALPLLGVSSYSKTSICLPMELNSGGAVAYLVFLLLFNGVAFLLVACAYWQMYRAVAGHGHGGGAAPAASSADTAIAKKMALLVFTDFACWAPVAFFGLTAVGGMPLIGVTDSKILLVFFYPLNACCNPYLYAILTKQYRRDLLLLLSRDCQLAQRRVESRFVTFVSNGPLRHKQSTWK
ncbi:unnamed protein product [Orchesella dallaii]|uniref:G-protein coupled receptors family 1 profile domain-containing protein n=1 Tax=Orchesella dallaii TaxID=48710 RepID=A0ABP1QTW7_9HEXA